MPHFLPIAPTEGSDLSKPTEYPRYRSTTASRLRTDRVDTQDAPKSLDEIN
jgi:hypothetical protein